MKENRMFDLSDKVALVVGGAGYLGVPVCRKLVETGSALVIADILEERVRQAVHDIKVLNPTARVSGMTSNVGDEADVKKAVDRTVQEYGKLDVVVNCTYRSTGKLVEELAGDEFDEANHVNITGAFFLSREAARVMPTGGSIIHFSSMYGQVAPDPRVYPPPMKPNPIEYGVGKAAIIQMVKYLAVYWGLRGIRVNAIAPGPFPNPAIQNENPAFVRCLAEKVPLGRIGQSNEIAGAVVFLASDEAVYITGQTLEVNGGWTVW